MKKVILFLFLVGSIKNYCLGQESLIDELYTSYKADQEKNVSFVLIRTKEYSSTPYPDFSLKISYGYEFVNTQASVLNQKTNEILKADQARKLVQTENLDFEFKKSTFVFANPMSIETKKPEESLVLSFK